MSDLSPRLALPYLMPSQAQKHVTHNEALRLLDALVQLSVAGFDAETPPASPTLGEAHALGESPLGAWAGHGSDIAIWQGEGWLFVVPHPGWRAWSVADAALRVWDGSNWTDPQPAAQETAQLGINTLADGSNRLSVRSPASLFTHDGDGHQMKINKATTGDTASLLLQSNWSGRAEIGLVGNDDLSVKVSADGSAWIEALRLNGSNGSLGLGATPGTAKLTLAQGGSAPDLLLATAGGSTAFRLTGAGDGLCAGSWQSGGADYAEFFEWHDGNPAGEDRRGLSVVLEGDRIRAASPGEDPIGVVSAAPALLGEGDIGGWSHRYLKDTYGAPLKETDANGQPCRVENPDFDPNKVYIPRKDRPEWAMVGLLGKLVLRKGQPVAPRWQHLRAAAEDHDLWLLR